MDDNTIILIGFAWLGFCAISGAAIVYGVYRFCKKRAGR